MVRTKQNDSDLLSSVERLCERCPNSNRAMKHVDLFLSTFSYLWSVHSKDYMWVMFSFVFSNTENFSLIFFVGRGKEVC